MHRLTPAEAGAIAARARKLLRLRRLTHHQYALLDALLWSCRTAGQATARVSYGQLQAAARMARATVASSLAALERLGLVQRQRHRVLAIGANGQRIWRQMVSSYRLLAAHSVEFRGRPDSKPQENQTVKVTASEPAQADAKRALGRVAHDMEARLAASWHQGAGMGMTKRERPHG